MHDLGLIKDIQAKRLLLRLPWIRVSFARSSCRRLCPMDVFLGLGTSVQGISRSSSRYQFQSRELFLILGRIPFETFEEEEYLE